MAFSQYLQCLCCAMRSTISILHIIHATTSWTLTTTRALLDSGAFASDFKLYWFTTGSHDCSCDGLRFICECDHASSAPRSGELRAKGLPSACLDEPIQHGMTDFQLLQQLMILVHERPKSSLVGCLRRVNAFVDNLTDSVDRSLR